MNAKMNLMFAAILAASTLALGSFSHAADERDVSAYNLEEGTGLKGYDPVAVFPEGGGRAQAGDPSISVDFRGVRYLFMNEDNRALFLASPDKFEPTYGGWCAYAMAFGQRVDIQPDVYTLRGNRIHYFVSRRAKANFDSKADELEAMADKNWKQISGEEPRY